MSSKAERNVIATLCLSEALGITVAQEYEKRGKESRSLKKLLGVLERVTAEARQSWPELDRGAYRRVEVFLTHFHGACLESEGDLRLVTSICLGIQSDARDALKDPERRSAIDKILKATNRIHKYFDRYLRAPEIYAQANRAIAKWYELAV